MSLLRSKGLVSEEDAAFVDYLIDCGQENVLNSLETKDAVQQFVTELRSFDKEYPGGAREYIRKCRDLLDKSSRGVNPFDGWTPSVPPTTNVEFNTVEYHQLEKEGMEELTHCGFVLNAGGLGERLGYHGIKVGLPIETFSHLTYLNWYIKKILAIQHRSKNPNCRLPFAIMTSESNNEITVNYLKNNNYFGMPPDQVYVTMQNCVPAVRNIQGEIACDPSGHVIRKPHGHGDIHLCLYRVGISVSSHRKDKIIDQWIEKYDLNRILFFQDTNTMSFHTMPSVIAISIRNNAHMVSTCVKRRPHEQTGGLCKLKHKNGDEMVCNVEYNQLEDVIQNTIDPRGDYADESGYSPFPGNCNILCINIRDYLHVIKRSHGIVPEFVNPKYIPGSRTEYLQPTRLESLMQDYPKLLLSTSHCEAINTTCLVVTLPRFMAWSPVKNDAVRAALLREKTGFEESPRSGEADVWTLFRNELVSMNDCPICNADGRKHIDVEEGAFVSLWPEAGTTTEELHQHLGDGVHIRKGSVVIIRCRNWFIENVDIDGCCVLGEDGLDEETQKGSLHLRNVKIHNKGWRYVPVDCNDMSVDVVYRMRGYTVDRQEQCVFSLKSKGEYMIDSVEYDGTKMVVLDD